MLMPIITKTNTPLSEKDEWRTPPELFRLLNGEFLFELDAAATKENALCGTYLEKHSLDLPWAPLRTFCNPPFSRAGDFLRKGVEEFEQGATCVFLIRADGVETKMWSEILMRTSSSHGLLRPKFQIRFLTPRVNYLNPDGICQKGVTFPSAVVVMSPLYEPKCYWWPWKEDYYNQYEKPLTTGK